MTTATAEPTATTTPPVSSSRYERTRKRMLSPVLLRLFMLAKLPLGLIAGLKVTALDHRHCRTTVPYRWLTTNPFRSTYFAAQSMAAELSTGALATLAVDSAPGSVAYLIVDMQGTFGKKATSLATFTCDDGEKMFAAVAETLRTGEPATATAETVGRMADGTEVSRFTFTWSFKRRRKTA